MHVHETEVEEMIEIKEESSDKVNINTKDYSNLLYAIQDDPPWNVAIVFGFQHYLVMAGATFLVTAVVLANLCIPEENYKIKSEIVGTVFFSMGIATIIQSIFGVRLPIIQGATASLLLPTLTMLKMDTMPPCSVASANVSNESIYSESMEIRMGYISGSLMVGSLLQIFIGFSGVMSVLIRFIGPVTITPVITLIALSLTSVAAHIASKQWWIALMTCVILILCIFIFKNIAMPFPYYSIKSRKFCIGWFKIFQICPILLGIGISWAICGVLTAASVFPSDKAEWGFEARADVKIAAIADAPWFFMPYPLRFARPRVYSTSLLGFLAGFICSIMESIGDYYAVARVSGAPPPPTFSLCRGISVEGISCFLCGLLGSPVGTTSYGDNIGAISLTRVGSRKVTQIAGCFMILLGMFTKVGSLFVSLPDPIVGGVFIVVIGMLAGVGLSNLEYVSLSSSRNIFIIGLSIFAGITIPGWVENNGDVIDLKVHFLTETVVMILNNHMFIGLLVALLLDNAIPASDEERGITAWSGRSKTSNKETDEMDTKLLEIYDFSIWKTSSTKTSRFLNCISYLPVCHKAAVREKNVIDELE